MMLIYGVLKSYDNPIIMEHEGLFELSLLRIEFHIESQSIKSLYNQQGYYRFEG